MAEWTEKHRPLTLDDVIGQPQVIKPLKIWAKKEVEDIPNLLLWGPPGTGKTSAARAFLKEGNFEYSEINAAQFNGREDIIKFETSFLNSGTLMSDLEYEEDINWKILPHRKLGAFYVFDKAEKLTKAAQDVMEKYIEDGPRNVKAIFIANVIDGKERSKVMDGLTKPLQSRFDKYEFKLLEDKYLKEIVLNIAKEEKLEVPDNVINELVKRAEGIPRNVVRYLYDYAVLIKGR